MKKEQYHFRGFTKRTKRKRFLDFLKELKKEKVPFKKDEFMDDERHKAGNSTIYGGGDGMLNYHIFRDDETLPINLVKKYATKMSYGYRLIFTILISLFILTMSTPIYQSYKWSKAEMVYGVVESIREDCYLARGLFSAPNEVCETKNMKVDGIWCDNVGEKIFKIGQSVELKCLGVKCK